jgi:endonuclease YncB( thermonuclease family)
MARYPRRLLLSGLLAVVVTAMLGAPAWAQGAACRPAQLVGLASNVDLVVRYSSGEVSPVRLAGLQPWPDSWPLAEQLPGRVAAVIRGTPLCLAVDAVERAPDGTPLRQAWLADGRGALAVLLVRQGLAQVAPDVEAVAPTTAAALRAAESEARAAQRGIWAVLNWLVPYTTPGGLMVTVDARLVPALDLLAQLEIGRPLVDALGRGNVTVFLMAEPADVWAHYDSTARVIGIDLSLAGADPRTLAALLSHEATHALSDQDGWLRQQERQVGEVGACYLDEYRASVTELQVWLQLYGVYGKVPAVHPYEQQENLELARYLRAPDRYAARVLRAYAHECAR